MTSRNTKIAIAVALLVVGGFAASKMMGGGGGGEEQQGGAFGMPVEAALAESDNLRVTVQAVGTLIAQEGITLRPEISGRVTEISFTDGQEVEKGQALLTLDASTSKAQLEQAEAQLALAERNYNRAVALVGRGAGTEQNRDQTSSDLRVAKATLELAKANFDKTHIVAPFAGTIGIRKVSIGDYVSPGQVIVTLQALNPMKLDFGVPELALSTLTNGQKVQVTVATYPGRIFEGTVSAVDPLIDPATRSVSVRALVPNEDRKLSPGMFASVTLVTAETPNSVFIPASSIWPVGNDSFVFKITDGVANMVPVTIAQRQADRVAIASGLAVGDQVVTAGQTKLTMGPPGPVPVTVIDPNAPKAAAPAEGAAAPAATETPAAIEAPAPEAPKPEGSN